MCVPIAEYNAVVREQQAEQAAARQEAAEAQKLWNHEPQVAAPPRPKPPQKKPPPQKEETKAKGKPKPPTPSAPPSQQPKSQQPRSDSAPQSAPTRKPAAAAPPPPTPTPTSEAPGFDSSHGPDEVMVGGIARGRLVLIQGLNSKPELNGQRALVGDFDASRGRYAVLLEEPPGSGQFGQSILLLKRDNFKEVPISEEGPQGAYAYAGPGGGSTGYSAGFAAGSKAGAVFATVITWLLLLLSFLKRACEVTRLDRLASKLLEVTM